MASARGRLGKDGEVFLTKVQAAGILHVPVYSMKRVMDSGALGEVRNGEGKERNLLRIPYSKVVELAEKKAKGEWQLTSLPRKRSRGNSRLPHGLKMAKRLQRMEQLLLELTERLPSEQR